MRQLLGGMLSSAFVGKGQVSWPRGVVTPGESKDALFIMDWATWIDKTFDSSGIQRRAFLDVESTILDLRTDPVYVAKKVNVIRRLVEAPGGLPDCINRLKANPAYNAFAELTEEPDVFLLFASNSTRRLPDAGLLQKTLRDGTAGFDQNDSRYTCDTGAEGAGLRVVTPKKKLVFIGLIDRLKLVELAALTKALDIAKRHFDLDDRFLFELTNLAGEPRLLQPMPYDIEVKEATPGSSIKVDGKSVIFQRFAVDPFDLMRLCTVLRLVTDHAYLQRLPDGPHLQAMADEVSNGGRFPTPVLCIPSHDVGIDSKSSTIKQKGGAPIPPYQWHLVDGQHRAFCYYLVDPGKEVQTIDVNCYTLANDADKASVSSTLFLDVNYKAIKPPIDLALSHHALASSWPRASWICRKASKDCPYHDSQIYSSRVLATRFLLELNGKSLVFKEFFKLAGAKDSGKSSVQSLSTYLSPEFEIRYPDDSSNPIARRFGTVKGAESLWKTRNPPPEALAKLWAILVQEFDDFLTVVAGPPNPDGFPENVPALTLMVKRNINVFVALWRIFYRYRFNRTHDGAKYPWPIAAHRGRAILAELVKQQRERHLFGKHSAFRSGSGVKKLTDLLVRKFDQAKSAGEPALADAEE